MPDTRHFSLDRDDFPRNFRFGASTSSYQVEGSAFGGCGPSHWDTFAATRGNVANGDNGSRACDHYHRYEADIDLLANAGFDSYRFSVSWPRVLPDGRGAINQKGLDFYDRLVDALLKRGIEPWCCLYHWDLPAALADLGGWQNRDIAGWFADYAQTVAARLGDRLAGIATINEPWCVAWLSHFLGVHAPGLRDIRAAARAMHHVLLAHGTAAETLRANGQENLGIILNFEYAQPADNSEGAQIAARLWDGIYNRWFMDALFGGNYPADVLAGLGAHMPAGFDGDMATIAAPLDWLGINYYTRSLVGAGQGPFPAITLSRGNLPQTDMGWEIYPDGLHQLLVWARSRYTKNLPLYVMENGMAAADRIENGEVHDLQRIGFFDAHLASVGQAIADGVPVKGYFLWSLLDNFEWDHGYSKRFGIVHVDFETLARTPKSSYHAWKAMLGSGRVL